jgi:hypothetical protein
VWVIMGRKTDRYHPHRDEVAGTVVAPGTADPSFDTGQPGKVPNGIRLTLAITLPAWEMARSHSTSC